VNDTELKSCCAAVYESDFARLLLGDSFHPGGLQLTEKLGRLLALSRRDHVLDIACGRGDSAIFLATQFGCRVTGIDLGETNVAYATSRAAAANVSTLARFELGDAERLQYSDASFDVVLCECAFCTFPNKQAATSEFARVLRSGGRLGLSDLTRSGELPSELAGLLAGLLAWIACIADARPVEEYVAYLERAQFQSLSVEPHDEALAQMVRDVRTRLLAAEMMVRLEKMSLPGVDFAEAKATAACAAGAIRSGLLGYSLITAIKPCG
jgi:ubiquinone/menaquinone biosynthesis C-methylase UbiE